MSPGDNCKECGTAIPAGAPGGLCGKCLFGLGLAPAQGGHETAVTDFGAEGAALLCDQPIPQSARPSAVPGAKGLPILTARLTEKAGDMIGPYHLLQQIGEGGFGVVYMAQQREPVKRRVALKIVKLGMDTKQVVARFEAERQALALMDHPNIAKVLDAGATDQGRPYFVMELVKGIRITEYCDQNHLTPRERLALFVPICRAIQHAHQKGIIHRDIKPSNILVTLHDGVPVPKIIDFGIAKATQQELTEQTVFTQFGQFIGTPAYMSPEQAEMSGLDVDTRSDIYSLGVLLYELLTGKTPFDTKDLLAKGLEEMRRVIREQEPARPSTRLSTLLAGELTTTAKHRRVEAPKLVRLIRGDLDWMVMKCLEKDRTRRYDTASNFADDIESFLNNEPVKARPPSATYRLQKLVRRNKIAFAAAAGVAIALIAGLVVSTLMFLREQEARRQSQEVARFLRDMLSGVGPQVALGRDTQLLQEILDKTVERLAKDLTGQPGVQAELCNTIGDVYRALGYPDKAEPMHRLARMLQGRPTRGQRAAIAASFDKLGSALRDQGKLAEAETLEREALALRRKLYGSLHSEAGRDLGFSLNNLAITLREEYKLPEAEDLLRQALALYRELLGAESLEVATSLHNLALTLREAGRYPEATTNLDESLRIRKKLRGDNGPEWALKLGTRAFFLLDLGKLDEAKDVAQQSLDSLRKFFPKGHPDVATAIHNLALVLSAQGHLAEAEALHKEALAMRRERLGDEKPEVAASLDNLAMVLSKERRLTEAEPLVRQALALRKKIFGDDHPAVAASLNDLALVLRDAQRPAEAEKAFLDALAVQKKRFGAEHPQIATTLSNLALLLGDEGRLDEAETNARSALEMRRKLLDEKHPKVAESLKDLEDILARERKVGGDSAEAAKPAPRL